MSDEASSVPSPSNGGSYLQAWVNWQTAVGGTMLAAQREQWEILVALQRTIGTLQRDLADRWISRFGGGVPLDG